MSGSRRTGRGAAGPAVYAGILPRSRRMIWFLPHV